MVAWRMVSTPSAMSSDWDSTLQAPVNFFVQFQNQHQQAIGGGVEVRAELGDLVLEEFGAV